MNILKSLNLLLAFLLELCMLAAVGYWGFKTQPGWVMKVLLGIGLPVLIAVLWGLFMAPRATRPLSGAPRLVLELLLFSSGALALFASGKPALGWAYTIALVAHEVFSAVWRQ